MKNLSKILAIGLCMFFVTSNAQYRGNEKTIRNEIEIKKERAYDYIYLKNLEFTSEVGHPQLPVRTKTFVIPFEAKVKGIQINNLTKQEISGKYSVYPVQPDFPLDGSDIPEFVEPNKEIYGASKAYPYSKKVEIISDQYMMGYHVVTVKIYPVEYIPKTGKLFYYNNIDFTIEYSLDNKKFKEIPDKQTFNRSNITKDFVGAIVENKQDIDAVSGGAREIIEETTDLNKRFQIRKFKDGDKSIEEELVPDYIIITNDELKSSFETLAEWKTRKGVPTFIITVEEIEPNYPGSDIQEKIRNYLKEAYGRWGAGLFVLLGGDVNVIPARMVPGQCCPYSPTDLYYATVSGTWNANNNNIFGESGDNIDHYPDFYLGRAPVENNTEAETFISKVLRYETQFKMISNSYLSNILILDAFLSKNSSCGTLCYSYAKEITQYIDAYVPSNISPWFMFDNHDCQYDPLDPFSTPFAYSPYQYGDCGDNYGMLPGGGTCTPGDEELNSSNVLSRMNNGNLSNQKFHLVYHMDHSGVTGMGMSSKMKNELLRRNDMDNLTNAPFHQIMFSNGCKPATFSKDCIGEHYVTNPNGGGVAFIGNADYGYYSEWAQFRNFCKALYETPNSPSIGANSNLGLLFQASPSQSSPGQKKRLTLLGDPEMPVWSANPQRLDVTVLPSISPNGKYIIQVNIANLPAGETANICLYKKEEGYTNLTATHNGNYIFTFVPHTLGDIDVTVTSKDFIPYSNKVEVSVLATSHLYIGNKSFDDNQIGASHGNNDKQNDAGETIEMRLLMHNSGNFTAYDLEGLLRCNSEYITIIDSLSEIDSVAPSGIIHHKIKPFTFTYKIDKNAPETLKNAPDDEKILFSLRTIDRDGNIYNESFSIDVFAPEIEQGNKIIHYTSNGNDIVEPGETVVFELDLFNAGKAVATCVSVLLERSSPYITMLDNESKYGDIKKYETRANKDKLVFKVSPKYTTGLPLEFNLLVRNEYGKRWEYSFDLLERPGAIDFNSIEFIAEKTSISLSWDPVSDAKGYNIYRQNPNSHSGIYTKANTFLVEHAYYEDVKLLELQKYKYKIAAISNTGNEGPLTAPFTAWTSYPYKDLYPIIYDISGGILSSINAIDTDGDNNLEIFASLRDDDLKGFILGLHANGTELYDIDGNVTTFSGFAKTDAEMWSLPAIGDMDGDGAFEIISSTRDMSVPRLNYLSCHSLLDNNNDNLPDLLWQETTSRVYYRNPVMANINNSSNGTLEAIYQCEWGGLYIYSASGQQLKNFNTPSGYGAIAVADMNNQGTKEILTGSNSGLYIYNYDGTAFSTNPIFSVTDYNFGCSPVVCDLDNNGDNEIIIIGALDKSSSSTPTTGRVYALNHNGTLFTGWNGSQEINLMNDWHLPGISVGDLDRDGTLEIVVVGRDMVKIWDRYGNLETTIDLDYLNPGKGTAILADIDLDNDIEIIFGTNDIGKIYGYNYDGTKVLGFPLSISSGIGGSPFVGDIDNNGKTDIVVGSGNRIYAWETNGNPNYVEWGSERSNSWNTGVYGERPAKKSEKSGNNTQLGETNSLQDSNSIGNSVTISPNPSNGIFNINIENTAFENTQYSIFDISGFEIDNKVIDSNNLKINLSDKSKGVYFLKIRVNNKISYHKLIVN